MVHPELFTTEKVSVTVDLNKTPGKTFVEFNENGNVEMITAVKREEFLDVLIKDLEKLNDIKLVIGKFRTTYSHISQSYSVNVI